MNTNDTLPTYSVGLGLLAFGTGLAAVVTTVAVIIVWRDLTAEMEVLRGELAEAEGLIQQAADDPATRQGLGRHVQLLRTRAAELDEHWLVSDDSVRPLQLRIDNLGREVASAEQLAGSESELFGLAREGLEGDADTASLRQALHESRGVRERIEAIGRETSALGARVTALLERLDQVEAQLAYAEQRAAYYECRAQVAEYRAAASTAVAECGNARAEFAECLGGAEADAGTALLVGCVATGIAVAVFTGGVGAPALAACALVGTGARAVVKYSAECGAEPECGRDADAALAQILADDDLDALPECIEPGERPQSAPLLAWLQPAEG